MVRSGHHACFLRPRDAGTAASQPLHASPPLPAAMQHLERTLKAAIREGG